MPGKVLQVEEGKFFWRGRCLHTASDRAAPFLVSEEGTVDKSLIHWLLGTLAVKNPTNQMKPDTETFQVL